MKKALVQVAFVWCIFGFFNGQAQADEATLDYTLQMLYKSAVPPPDEMQSGTALTDKELTQREYALTRVDSIVIHVENRFIEVSENVGDGAMVKTYPAGTATKGKNTRALPFGEEGWFITSIALNPDYRPTKDTRDEYFKKHKKRMKKYHPPGNALGNVKFYFSHNGTPSTLGMHDTDNQASVSKRFSHGCVRLKNGAAMALAKLILNQNGYDAEKILSQAAKNPKKTIRFKIADGPSVHFERN